VNGPGPVRVMHLINGLSGGGLERWLWDIIRLSSGSELEHRVVAIYPDLGGSPVYADALSERGALEDPGSGALRRVLTRVVGRARVYRNRGAIPRPLSLPLRIVANSAASLRVARAFIRFRPDVVHAHSGPDVLLGVLMRMVFRKPLVHTVPCLFSQMEDADYHWLPEMYRRFHPWIDRFSTGEARSELLSVGVPEAKILYDLGGVDLDVVDRALAQRDRHYREVRGELGLPGDALIALSVGRLHSSKGHDHALEALPRLLERVPKLHWVVLGEGPERETLEARVRELGVSGHAHLIGFRSDPFRYLAAADLYLRTNLLEPENLSFYQSMAAALPTVGFDTGWPDLIGKVGHGHLVPNGDVPAFAAAVARILALDDRGRALGQLAREYARRHLDVRSSVSLLTSCYASLSQRHGAAGASAAG